MLRKTQHGRQTANRLQRRRLGGRGLPQRSTLFDLIRMVQPRCGSAGELVEVVASLVNSGRVVLTGSFQGEHL